MTNRRFARALRRTGPLAGVADHPARDGPRALDPGGDRGDRAARRPPRPRAHRQAQPLPRRRRGAQLRGQRRPAALRVFDDIWIQPAAGDAGGAVGAALAFHYMGTSEEDEARPRPAQRALPGGDGMQGAFLGPEFSDAEIAAFLDARGYPYRRLAPEEWAAEIARRIAAERVVGLVPGPHGVRPALARQPLDRRRSALAADAVGDEPEDQVPRELPAVRAGGARGALARRLRARSPLALHAAGRSRRSRALPAEAGRRARPAARRVGEPAALRPAGDHPRRLFGARADGLAGDLAALPRPAHRPSKR